MLNNIFNFPPTPLGIYLNYIDTEQLLREALNSLSLRKGIWAHQISVQDPNKEAAHSRCRVKKKKEATFYLGSHEKRIWHKHLPNISYLSAG